VNLGEDTVLNIAGSRESPEESVYDFTAHAIDGAVVLAKAKVPNQSSP
jgi:hypothetical protein